MTIFDVVAGLRNRVFPQMVIAVCVLVSFSTRKQLKKKKKMSITSFFDGIPSLKM